MWSHDLGHIWNAALNGSVFLTKSLKSTRAISFAENTIWETLYRARLCLAMLNLIPVENFFFMYLQNRRHTDELYPCLDRGRHNSHEWLVGCVSGNRKSWFHRTVIHMNSYVNPDSGDHSNTIEDNWREVKVFLRPHNRYEVLEYHLAHSMFAARCKKQGIFQLSQFLAIAAVTHCDITFQKCSTTRVNFGSGVTWHPAVDHWDTLASV